MRDRIKQWRDELLSASHIATLAHAHEPVMGNTHIAKKLNELLAVDEQEGLAAKLAEHWLWEMECDHEEKKDKAKCACGWVSDWLPNVGKAALAWATHALEATK